MAVSTKKILLLLVLISIVVLATALVWNDLNFSFFVRLLWDDANEFATKGIITSNFMPPGYTGFLGSCIKIGGAGGIPACQSLIYIGILFVASWFLKLRGLRDGLLALGVLAIALHPMLLLNIWRIHDGNLTAFLFFGFLVSGILFLRSVSAWNAIFFGAITGLLFTVRPNTLLLFLAAIFIIFWKSDSGERAKNFLKVLIFLAIAVIFIVGVNFAIKQKPFFFPPQGLYNLFSGTNEYALRSILRDYGGENSHEEALKAKGFPASSVDTIEKRLAFPSQKYKELVIEFIKTHPVEYLKLTALRFFTFFRPGYHVPQHFEWSSIEGFKRLIKIVLALPFFIWVFFVWKTRENFFDKENFFTFLLVVLYILPVVFTNADPRYRFPLDMAFILDSFCRIRIKKFIDISS